MFATRMRRQGVGPEALRRTEPHHRAELSFHRRSVLFIPEAKEARTVPLGASDGEGHLGEAVISLAIPGKAVGHHHHPLRPPSPGKRPSHRAASPSPVLLLL